MKNLILILAFLFTSCVSVGFGPKEAYTFRALEVSAGVGELEEADQFDDTDPTTTVGVSMLVQESGEAVGRPTGFTGDWGLAYSQGSGSFDQVALVGGTVSNVTVDHEYAQAHAGLRYYVDVGPDWVQPYIGGAVATRYYRLDAGAGDDASEFAFGLLGRAGVDFQVGSRARLGLGYSLSGHMDPDINDVKTDLDDHMLFVSFGWSL